MLLVMSESSASPRITEGLHKTTIELGAMMGVAVVIVYLIWAIASGNITLVRNGVGPAVLAIVAIVMLRRKWYHAEFILLTAAVSTIISYRFFGNASSASPAMIGIVVIVAIGALFADERRKWHYVVVATVGLLFTALFWDGITLDALWSGVTGAFSALVAMTLFVRIQESATKLDRRYRVLVEQVPLPLLEEDWSSVRAWLDQLRAEGVTDIEAYLDDHPDELSEVSLGVEVRGANPAIAAMFSPSGDYAFSEGLNHGHLQPFFRDQVIGMWHGAEVQPSEYQLVQKGGKPFWARMQAVDIEEGLIEDVDRVVVASDVTALKEAQSQLADEVRSKDEFVAAVSHELRTPLTSILGFAEVINESPSNLTPDGAEYMSILLDQAADMAHIVEDLLVAARAEIGTVPVHPQRMNLRQVAERATAEAYESFDLRVLDEPWVMADPLRVSQIIRNLLSNATRYGGTERKVRVCLSNSFGVVEVRDNGEPIPAEVRERIFDPYTRAQDRPGLAASVGLGLSISRQLARLMDGDVTYAREDGESVFRLTLPLAEIRAVGAA